MTKSTQTTATNPPATFNLQDLEAIIKSNPEALKSIIKSIKATENTDTTDKAIIKAFEKAGYKNVVLFDRTKDPKDQPNCTVLTYKRWLELGRVVKKGERAIKARGYHIRLFHRDQTEPASADKLPAVSPIAPTKPAKAPAKGVRVHGTGSLQ